MNYGVDLRNIKKAPLEDLGKDLRVAERKLVASTVDYAKAVIAALADPPDYELAISHAQRMHIEIAKASDAAQIRTRYASEQTTETKETP